MKWMTAFKPYDVFLLLPGCSDSEPYQPHSALVWYCIHCSNLGNVYKEFIYKFTK